jgi:hypothetical protein
MPWGLKRFHESGQTHFITFTCWRKIPTLDRCAVGTWGTNSPNPEISPISQV